MLAFASSTDFDRTPTIYSNGALQTGYGKQWDLSKQTIEKGAYVVFVTSPNARPVRDAHLIHGLDFVRLNSKTLKTGTWHESVLQWLSIDSEEAEPLGKAELSWFEEITKGKDIGVPSDVMTSAYIGIQSLLESRDFEMLDWLFEHASPVTMAPEAMIALLRYAFAGRDHIDNWSKFLASVKDELIIRGFDTEKLLRGMEANEGGAQQAIR